MMSSSRCFRKYRQLNQSSPGGSPGDDDDDDEKDGDGIPG